MRTAPAGPRARTLTIFLAAAAVRLAVGASLWQLPLVRSPRLDSAEYFAWAQRLAAGESAWPVVAQHGPGYPMFLAALLVITNGSLIEALALQSLLGAVTATLIASVARSVSASVAGGASDVRFATLSAWIAGLAYALYGPVVYVETVVLSEGLLLLLLALALWALTRSSADWRMTALAGASIGVATIVRPTAVVIGIGCLAWLIRERQRGHTGHMVSFVMSALLFVVPVVAKNYVTSGTLSIQGYGGLNVYIGNSPLHDGRATFRLGGGWDALNSEAMRAGLSDAASQDRYYLNKIAGEIKQHPASYVGLLFRKFLWMLQAEESRDSHSYYFFTEQSTLLRLLPRFSVLFPLACVGMWVVARRQQERNEGPFVLVRLLAVYTITAAATIIFLVVGLRYRMPLVPALTVFCGIGGSAVFAAGNSKLTRESLSYAIVAILAVAVSHVLHDPANTNPAEEYAFTGSSLVTERKLSDAERAYRRALELDPHSGLAWDGLGLTLYDAGRLAEARSALERALSIEPANSRALFHLALVDERGGAVGVAADGYERALALSPNDADTAVHLARARRAHATELGLAGKTREARDEMRRAVQAAPNDGEAWLDLCLLAEDLGDRTEAADALQRAKSLGADPARAAFAEQALQRVR
jgi:Tfp pilus assembly protein PilF